MFVKLKTRNNEDIHINPAQVSSVSKNGKWTVIHMAGHSYGVMVKGTVNNVIKQLDVADLLVPKIKKQIGQLREDSKAASKAQQTKTETKKKNAK